MAESGLFHEAPNERLPQAVLRDRLRDVGAMPHLLAGAAKREATVHAGSPREPPIVSATGRRLREAWSAASRRRAFGDGREIDSAILPEQGRMERPYAGQVKVRNSSSSPMRRAIRGA